MVCSTIASECNWRVPGNEGKEGNRLPRVGFLHFPAIPPHICRPGFLLLEAILEGPGDSSLLGATVGSHTSMMFLVAYSALRTPRTGSRAQPMRTPSRRLRGSP
jgi:hypothetical protein